MNHFDVNKAQVQSLGSSVQLKREMYANTVRFQPEKPQIEQDEKTLLRTLIEELTKSGKYDDAIHMLLNTIEDMQKDIKEMKK